jgi:hypothetical protein
LTIRTQSETIAQGPPLLGPAGLDARFNDRFGSWAVTGVGVLAMVGLIPWLGISIYLDEGASLYSAHLSWSNLWAQSQHQDLVLLPYYVLLHFWLLPSGSIEWARTPSLLAFGAVVILVGRIGLRIGGRWCGIVTAVFAATNTLMVEKTLNVRPYELAALGATLCGVFLVKWLEDGRRSRLWLFSVFGIATALLQIFTVLAPLAMVAAVLLVRPSRLADRLRAMAWPIGTLVLATAAFAAATAGQVGQVSWIGTASTTTFIENARGPAIGNLYDVALLIVAICALLIPHYFWDHGGRAMWSELLNRDREYLALAVGWAVVPTLLLVAASIVRPVFWDRYATASAPGLALLCGLVSARIIQLVRGQRRTGKASGPGESHGRGLAVVGTLVVVILSVSYLTTAPIVTEDLQGLTLYVADHAKPGDAIVLHNHALTTAVVYYFARDGRSVTMWPEVGVRQRYPDGLDLVLSPGAPFRLPHRLWVVDDGDGLASFSQSVLDRYYTLTSTQQFIGVSLSLYSR